MKLIGVDANGTQTVLQTGVVIPFAKGATLKTGDYPEHRLVPESTEERDAIFAHIEALWMPAK